MYTGVTFPTAFTGPNTMNPIMLTLSASGNDAQMLNIIERPKQFLFSVIHIFIERRNTETL